MATSVAPAKRPKSQLAETFLGRNWYIVPERLQAMRAAAELLATNPSALTAWADARVPETYLATTKDGIATVQINGPLERISSFWSWYFGGTSYEVLAADMARLRDDPAIRAIILQFDTGGGEVAGCGECAEVIARVAAVKPVVSHIAGWGCSAGYYLASPGRLVIADPAAVLGSIGTCATFVDCSGLYEELGIEVIEMVSTQSPRKNLDPTTHEGRADWQALLDALADVFIADLSTYRDVPVATVLRDFGKGGVFVGQQAIDAGLADALGTHDRIQAALLAELDGMTTDFSPDSFQERLTMSTKTASRRAPASPSPVDPAARVRAEKEETPTPKAETEDPPVSKEAKDDDEDDEDDDDGYDASAVARFAAKASKNHGVTAAMLEEFFPEAAADLFAIERDRIGAILKIGAKVKGPKAEQAVAAAIANPDATAQALAFELLDSGAAAGAAKVSARDQDEAELDAPPNTDSPAGSMSEQDRAVHLILHAGKTPAKR